jgi:2-methylcitrate dehydratase PrpD
VASAILALAEHTGASGRALVDALVLGIDVACRLGNTVYPEHYDRGWHITGTTGMFGAAAGCARLLGWTPTARPWRWASRPRSRSACASSSAP